MTAADPDSQAAADGSLLPGPHAKLAGPTFEEWLTGQVTEDQSHRRLLR